MAQTYTINGTDYTFPDVDDSDWGQNVTDWAGAVSSFLLQRSGGTFTLGAAVDFGTSFGLKLKDLESKTASASTDASAFLRLAKTDYISWRNNAGDANLTLEKGTDDLLQFNSIDLVNLSATQTLTNKTLTTPVISSISNTGTLTLPTSTDTLVGRATTDTLTNKTMTSPVINTGISGTAIDNNTSLGSSATKVPTQNAVKSYVDAQVTASDLDFSGDSGGAQSVDLDSQSLTVEGGTGVDTTGSAQKVSIAIDSSVTTNSGTQTLTNKTLTSPKVNEDVVMTTTSTYLNRMDATSSVQTQLNAKQATITGAATTIASSDLTASKVVQSNGSGKIEASTVTTTTLGYLDATSSVQTQLNAKQATVTGAATTITGSDLTASKVLQSNGSGKVEASTVTTTTLGYLDATSSVQTQLDAKAPLASPYFTTYADFDSQGSAPAAPSNTGDVRLYAKDSKFYFHPQGGSATEIGSGGGVGSIDTLFTLQAKTADAATSGSGNDAVFLGGGTLSNATVTLDTTAADLIGTDKVFKYNATGDSIRNYWYHEQSIYPGYAGKNMVLQLQYYTRNGADGESFRFVARDATMPILSVTADGTNTITGTIDATVTTAPVVGDKIIFKDSSNNIYYRYITVIVKNSGSDGKTSADNMTYTYSGSDVTATGKVVTGIMTDELDYLPGNDITGNEAKIYRKQMLFPDNCTTFQFGFHCLDSDTDIELFYDDIALSANQFLQTSSQGQSEEYMSNGWGGRVNYRLYGGTERINTLNELGSVSVGDSSNGWRYTSTAKQKVNMTTTAGLSGGDSYLAILKGTIAQVGTSTTSASDASYAAYRMAVAEIKNGDIDEISASFVVEKDEIIEVATSNNSNGPHTGATNASVHLTATPLVNDVVLLNSQDEIFTDWTSYTPTLNGVTSTAANTKFAWRRVGDSMEIAGSWYTASVAASELYFTLPSGYEIDQATFYSGDRTSVGVASRLASSIYGYEKGNTCNLFIKAGGTNLDKIYFNYQSGGSYFSGVNGNGWMGTSEAASIRVWSVPIKGWTSTFNPVLSMPLVDLGEPAETWFRSMTSDSNFWDGTGVQRQWNEALLVGPNTSSATAGNIATSNLISIEDKTSGSNTVTAIVAKQDIILTAIISSYINSTGNIYWLNQNDQTLSTEQTHNADNYIEVCPVEVYLRTGEYIWAQTDAYSNDGGITITAKKVQSGNMAHIIKPAVVTISHEDSSYGVWGGDIGGTNAWHTRTLNTIRGESWFVESLSSNIFTLGAGMYKVIGQAPLYEGNQHKIRLYNTTDSEVTLAGHNAYCNASNNVQTSSLLMGSFTITKSTGFRIEHILNNDNGGISQGSFDSGGSNSGPSVFTTVMIEKLK